MTRKQPRGRPRQGSFAPRPGQGCRIGGGPRLEVAPVMVEGGLRAVRNRVEAGSGPRGHRAGMLALPSDSTQPLVVTGNQLEGDGLLLNWSGQDMQLAENRVPPDALEASRAGAWWFTRRQWPAKAPLRAARP